MFLDFFEPFRPLLTSKFAKSANMKKEYLSKMQDRYKKSQNLILISNSLKKLQKDSREKVISEKVTEK